MKRAFVKLPPCTTGVPHSFWYMKAIKDQLTDDWRDWCHIAGDAVFCVEATDENLKIMEDILDS